MQHRSAITLSLSFAKRVALAGLLLCVALAQSLSFAHRALHHDVRMLAHAHQEQHAELDQHAHGADCDHGVFKRLFASHEEGDESCRLLDASSSFLGLNSPLALVLHALNAHVFIASNTGWLSAWHAPLFEARAPPALFL